MILTFGEVETVLALMHGVADERRSAFSHRIKHLQRLRFPPGTNTGRGRAAIYQLRHVALLAVLLEMNEVGLTPEPAVRVCLNNLPVFQKAAYRALSGLCANVREQLLIEFDPGALSDLRSAEAMADTPRCEVQTQEELVSLLSNNTFAGTRLAIVNVTAVLSLLCHHLANASGKDRAHVQKLLLRAAEEEDWSDGNS